MMRKLCLYLLILLSPALSGQTQSTVLEWEYRQGQLYFPDALYADGENTLPYLSKKIAWTQIGSVPKVNIRIQATSIIDTAQLQLGGTGLPGTEPGLEYQLVGERGQSYLQIRLLPFISGKDGQIEIVEAFDLEITEEAALSSLRYQRKGAWSASSVLSSGNWFKVAVENSGMHRLSYEQLQDMGMANPAMVSVYGRGGRQLPEAFSKGNSNDLEAVPVYMDKGGDGLFGPGDFILFYAEGPVSWSWNSSDQIFDHDLHDYSHRGYYFLTDSQDASPAPESAQIPGESPTQDITSFDFRDYVEEETYNLIHSGREWFGDPFGVSTSYNYPFQVPGLETTEDIRLRIVLAARSTQRSSYSFTIDGQYKGSTSIQSTYLGSYTATYAYQSDTLLTHRPSSGTFTLGLSYNRPDNDSRGWLNFITLLARSKLSMNGADELTFRDSRSVAPFAVSRFQLDDASGAKVWDISDPSSPLDVSLQMNGSQASFTLSTDKLREFIAFRPDGAFPSPAFSGDGLGAIDNQNLHGLEHADMIIITPEIFLEEAERLAQHRRSNDGLSVEVVLQQQVFNEFSSGTPDITAIRNFMKMFYDRAAGGDDYCRYLLLFGDGSFDNRGNSKQENNPNFLLTYQSPESLSPTRSYTSDDFFGLLDTDEIMYNGLLDIGIGRLPISTVEEAAEQVDKLIAYDLPENQGDWRNQICFIGDDEDGNIHMRQADQLADYVNTEYPAYNIGKIFLDAYPQETSATGDSYPDVEAAINNQVNRGALIVNYTGHGGTQGLAHEKIVSVNSINSWSNGTRLPLFMTATCEFSRYDEYDIDLDINEPTAGEQILLSTKGGGIALFTTTRLVYSGPNHTLNEKFYEVVFEKNDDQENYRLGDIIAYSKNNTGAGVNKRNFTLLGDPSLRLSYPEHRVVTDSIMGNSVLSHSDTLSAFQWVSVSGHLESRDGSPMDSFNGTIYPVVYDKKKNVQTLSNDNGSVFNFQTRSNVLYSGNATVRDGRFSFGFYVPKDIGYAYGPGKISYYSNDSVVDAHGFWEDFTVGGISTDNAVDSEPPVVDLFLNDSFFIDGGVSDANPWLLVYASDNYGINTTGNGIGHDLTATLDDDRVGAVILNDFFQSNADSHNSGMIRYPYYDLEEGAHEIRVKIWDIHNNSTEETLNFVVSRNEGLFLENLFNYPNPAWDETFFNIEHNRPDQEVILTITLYDMNGSMVRIIRDRVYSPGYRLEPPRWDGTGSGGQRLGGGLYIYRVVISTDEGEEASGSGKLILLE